MQMEFVAPIISLMVGDTPQTPSVVKSERFDFILIVVLYHALIKDKRGVGLSNSCLLYSIKSIQQAYDQFSLPYITLGLKSDKSILSTPFRQVV